MYQQKFTYFCPFFFMCEKLHKISFNVKCNSFTHRCNRKYIFVDYVENVCVYTTFFQSFDKKDWIASISTCESFFAKK